MALVITGSPGVGKHTVAKRVAKKMGLDGGVLDINKMAVEGGAVKGSEGAAALDVDVRRLEGIMRQRLPLLRNPLVVGHLAPYVLTRRQVETAVILRKSPYKLDGVYKRRGYSSGKRIENQASEILGIVAYDAIAKFGREKAVQIDTTGRSVRETAEAVEDAILGRQRQQRRRRRALPHPKDAVDWLGLVNDNGDMGRFFPTD